MPLASVARQEIDSMNRFLADIIASAALGPIAVAQVAISQALETPMLLSVSHAIQRVIRASCRLFPTRFIGWTDPPRHSLVRGLASDLARGGELVAENGYYSVLPLGRGMRCRP